VDVILEIIASIIIITGSAYIGIIYASKYENSVKQIESFADALKMLEFDISFLRLPLTEAFERISKNQSGVIKKFFKFLSEELKEKNSKNVGELFKKAVFKYKNELLIGENAENILLDFSNNMGLMDAQNEIANIKSAYTKLKYYENEARESAKKNVKMCRGLGLLAGIFIVLVFC